MAIEEKVIVGEDTKYPLPGLLTLPEPVKGDEEVLFPAVVLVHGSGPNDMNETIGKTTLFKDLANKLSALGIAVLRYDKRTFAHGNQMKKNRHILLTVHEETVEDAIRATNLLKKDSRIDSSNIFLIGHSLGGMLAPRIDVEGGDFAGLIIMGGSPRRLQDIIKDQNEQLLQSLFWLLRFLVRRQIKKMEKRLERIEELNDREAKTTYVLGKELTAYYFKEMNRFPLNKQLKRMEKPILILHGEKDFHVSIEKDFEGYKDLLDGAENVAFKQYPNLNHLFMPSIYGSILKAKQEYRKEQHIDEGVVKDIAQWIHANKKT